jgi:hypothetical protein
MTTSTWVTRARKLLGKTARHLGGDGPYATVTPCGHVAFSLWPTLAEAKRDLLRVKFCGAGCRGARYHYIQNFEEND